MLSLNCDFRKLCAIQKQFAQIADLHDRLYF